MKIVSKRNKSIKKIKAKKVQCKFLRNIYLKKYWNMFYFQLKYLRLTQKKWEFLKIYAPESGYSSQSHPLFLPVKSKPGALAKS